MKRIKYRTYLLQRFTDLRWEPREPWKGFSGLFNEVLFEISQIAGIQIPLVIYG